MKDSVTVSYSFHRASQQMYALYKIYSSLI